MAETCPRPPEPPFYKYRLRHFWLAATTIYLTFAIFSINKPLTLDQAQPTATQAAAIATYGWDALGNSRSHYEISHTLLHVHLVALSFQLFGESTVAARAVGLLCFLGVLFMIIILSLELYPRRKGLIVGGIAALLYALNPFAVQRSLLVSEETTLVPLTLLLFIYYLYRTDFHIMCRSLLILSALFALSLWAKEFPPFFLLAALFPFLWLYRGVRQAFIITGAIALLGILWFGVSWGLYCALTGVPLLSFIEYSTIDKLFDPAFHEGLSLLRIGYSFAKKTFYVTPALTVLLVLAAIRRVKLFRSKRRRLEPTDYLWIYVGIYLAVTHVHFLPPRYQYPVYSVAVILIGEYLFDLLKGVSKRQLTIALVVGLVVAIGCAAVLADPHRLRVREYVVMWTLAPVLACCVLVMLAGISVRSRGFLAVAGVSFLVATNVGIAIQQTRPYTTAPSWGEYGEEGFGETLEYLRASVGQSVPVIRKDLAYYLRIGQPERKYIYNRIFRKNSETPRREIERILLREDVSVVVLDRFASAENVSDILYRYYVSVRKYGDFEVFRKRERNQ